MWKISLTWGYSTSSISRIHCLALVYVYSKLPDLSRSRDHSQSPDLRTVGLCTVWWGVAFLLRHDAYFRSASLLGGMGRKGRLGCIMAASSSKASLRPQVRRHVAANMLKGPAYTPGTKPSPLAPATSSHSFADFAGSRLLRLVGSSEAAALSSLIASL